MTSKRPNGSWKRVLEGKNYTYHSASYRYRYKNGVYVQVKDRKIKESDTAKKLPRLPVI